VNGKPLKIPALPPILGEPPGRTDPPAPALGAPTDAVLAQRLGRKADERAALRAAGAI
jgi:crotonobetainyl-CoA:carnitine CoA-transferase CaiB-like acyl-CoA transferase